MTGKKIALVLSGGAARGFSHIGAVRVLLDHKIPIDLIVGTSAGSLVGAAMASGLNGDEILKLGRSINWLNIIRPAFSTKALLSSSPIKRFIDQNIAARNIEDTAIPFAAVAYDLIERKAVVLREGDLARAVQASCAVPGLFSPVVENGRMLVDGGVVAPLPTDIAREMGADIVIGVDLLAAGATFHKKPWTAAGIMIQSGMRLLRTASDSQNTKPDIAIVPQIAHLRPDQISKRDEFVRLGEESALAMIDEIKAIVG
ncbi:MAG: patatin-like phospholipase family protein [Acidobacteriota bacterium]